MSSGGALDPGQDPDRYDPSLDRQDDETGPLSRTLPDLLGAGAHEQDRVGIEWLVGLLGVLAFLGLVAFLFARVLSPA